MGEAFPVIIAVGGLLSLGIWMIVTSGNGTSGGGGDYSDTNIENALEGVLSGSTDSSTWPTGDAVWDICRAIAQQEGYGVPGSRPQRNNNPGDISDTGVGETSKDSGGLDIFPDASTGWTALYNKIVRVVNGNSSTYPSTDSILQFGYTYAGGDPNWGPNVASYLGVDPSSSFNDYVEANS